MYMIRLPANVNLMEAFLEKQKKIKVQQNSVQYGYLDRYLIQFFKRRITFWITLNFFFKVSYLFIEFLLFIKEIMSSPEGWRGYNIFHYTNINYFQISFSQHKFYEDVQGIVQRLEGLEPFQGTDRKIMTSFNEQNQNQELK